MKWRNGIGWVALVRVCGREAFAGEKCACAEYFQATPAGHKKAEAGVEGTLIFDGNSKKVEFLNPTGEAAFSINSDAIRSMQYERTGQPRYLAAVVISPAFLLTRAKKHYLTIAYSDQSGEAHSVIVQLNKRNARKAVATATAQTSKSVEQIEEK